MRFVRSWLGVLCAIVLLAAPVSAQNAQPIGSAAPDLATLRAIEAEVSQIRGLQPLSEPELRVLDHVALDSYLRDQMDRDYLPSERESDQKQWVALGLIKSTDDLFEIQLKLLGDQVIGVYDAD